MSVLKLEAIWRISKVLECLCRLVDLVLHPISSLE